MSIRIASSNLNQTPLDWEKNLNNIKESIDLARKNNVKILCLPELAITGYGCQDLFYHNWFINKSYELLNEIKLLTKSITVIVGHPISFKEKLYNSCCNLISLCYNIFNTFNIISFHVLKIKFSLSKYCIQ